MTDRDLELALRALGARLREEEGPDLVGAVAVRIAADAPARHPRRRAVAAGCLAAAVLAGGAVAASPGVRDEVRSWLGASGVDVRTTRTVTAPAPRTVADLGLGPRVTAARARRLTGTVLPAGGPFGPPASVHLTGGARPAVSFVWRPSGVLPAVPGTADVGAVLTVGPVRVPGEPFVIAKSLPPGSDVRYLRPAGGEEEAVWISGVPHAVTTMDGRTERFRLAANVLLWRDGDRLHRLELAAGAGTALAAAEWLLSP